MDSPVTKLIFIAAAVAGAALVVGVMWATLGGTSVATSQNTQFDKLQNEALCKAAGGNWGTGNPRCTP